MPLCPPARALLRRIALVEPAVPAAELDRLGGLSRSLADGATGPEAAAPAFVAAPRRIGRAPLGAGDPLAGPDDPVPTAGWTADDAARAALLLAVADQAPDRLAGLVDHLYREGDSREKRAILRALPLLPDGARFVELALDASRTNETDLFAVLATGNPFPARHFAEHAWNQLVMKAALVGAPVSRMIGLERRANRELCRMALDYRDQERSAGRPFPTDLWLVIAPFEPSLVPEEVAG